VNIDGVLVFSRVFTNAAINHADPIVMSNFGLLMIVAWGLAYLDAATIHSIIKWLAGAFVLEKLAYVAVWVGWMIENSLASVYAIDLFAGIFYSILGLNDFVFILFFAWLFFPGTKKALDKESAGPFAMLARKFGTPRPFEIHCANGAAHQSQRNLAICM